MFVKRRLHETMKRSKQQNVVERKCLSLQEETRQQTQTLCGILLIFLNNFGILFRPQNGYYPQPLNYAITSSA